MAVGRTLALCFGLMMVVGGRTPAAADGLPASNLQQLWQYWSSRETLVQNLSTPFLSRSMAFPTPVAQKLPNRYHAFLNFDGPQYPDAQGLVDVGAIRPWYTSPSLTRFNGGQALSPEQQNAFSQDVFQKVEQTFANSGLGEVTLTKNAADKASHTLSVISGTTYKNSGDILGMTYTGGSGFSFLDNFSNPAVDSLDKLETALAKNISHELMHAFGGDHRGVESPYLDAAQTTWTKLTSESTVFSAEAASDLRSFLDGSKGAHLAGLVAGERILSAHRVGCVCSGCCDSGHAEALTVRPIPEPSTLAIGGVSALAFAMARRRRDRRAA